MASNRKGLPLTTEGFFYFVPGRIANPHLCADVDRENFEDHHVLADHRVGQPFARRRARIFRKRDRDRFDDVYFADVAA